MDMDFFMLYTVCSHLRKRKESGNIERLLYCRINEIVLLVSVVMTYCG
jgi:hypothetical protein